MTDILIRYKWLLNTHSHSSVKIKRDKYINEASELTQKVSPDGGTRGGTHVVPAWYPCGARWKIGGTLGTRILFDPIIRSVSQTRLRGEVSFL